MAKSEADSINTVVTDAELERGEHPVGSLVHIATVTHAWRGHLAAVTASYYMLDPTKSWTMVDNTGPVGAYVKKPAASEAETVEPTKKGIQPRMLIPRSAVAWIIAWVE